MNKAISMKKLYKWASEYADWKRKPENNHGTTDDGISIGCIYISDFLKMVWEKRNE